MTRKELDRIIFKFNKGIASDKEKQLLESLERKAEKDLEKNIFSDDSHESQVKDSIYSKINPVSKKQKPRYSWAIAASFLLLIGLSGYYFLNHTSKIETVLVYNDEASPKVINLPDGTTVTLNTESKLFYNSDFNERLRNVSLQGEGYFKVSKNADKPFTVTSGTLSTTVLGTEFNVKEGDDTIQVTLVEGAVKVYYDKDTLNLEPDHQATFEKNTRNLRRKTVNSNLYNLWMKNQIVLNDISMEELGIVLYSIYGYILNPTHHDISQKRLSIAFNKNEGIDKIIERINYQEEVELTKKPNNMIEIK
jgi:ferric-dicitrate binding protein FerR (iron transport regulator)